MKRNWKMLLTALLLVLTLAFVAACNRNNEPDEPTPVPPVVEEPTPPPVAPEEPTPAPPTEQTPAVAFVAAPAGHVWSLSRDPVVQGLARGTMGSAEDLFDETPYIIAAGSPVFSIEESPFGGNALGLNFRTENWFALDLYTAAFDFNLASNAYVLTIYGSVAEPGGTTIIIGGADGPWNWLFHDEPNEDGSFMISGVISIESMEATGGGLEQFARCFRIQTNNLSDFVVYEILVVQVPRNHVWSLSRDPGVQALAAGTMGMGEDVLARTPYLQAAGSPMFVVVDSPYGGNALELAFRTENWFALDLTYPSLRLDPDANEYSIRLTGRAAESDGTQVIIGGADGPWNWLFNSEPNADGSFTVEGIITRATMEATSGGSEQFERCIRIQTNNLVDFTVYEIEILRVGSAEPFEADDATDGEPAPAVDLGTGTIWNLYDRINAMGLSVGDSIGWDGESGTGDAGATMTIAANNAVYVDVGNNGWGAGMDIFVNGDNGGIQAAAGDVIIMAVRIDGTPPDNARIRLMRYGDEGGAVYQTFTSENEEITLTMTIDEAGAGGRYRIGGMWAEGSGHIFNFYVVSATVYR